MTNFECFNLGTQFGTEGCTPPPSRSLDKLEFTGAKILVLIFLVKNFVKQELFCSNANKVKNPERWTFRKRDLVEALYNAVSSTGTSPSYLALYLWLITKFWVILQMVVNGVLGIVFFLGLLTSTYSKSKPLPFHHKCFFLFWLLTVKYFLWNLFRS